MKKITNSFGFLSSEKKKQPKIYKSPLDSLEQSGRYLGVKIDRCGCNASSRYVGQIFLFENAPTLPIAGCNAQICSCQYLGVPNRRSDTNRRVGRDRRESIRMEEDRRTGKERRGDLKNWKGYDR